MAPYNTRTPLHCGSSGTAFFPDSDSRLRRDKKILCSRWRINSWPLLVRVVILFDSVYGVAPPCRCPSSLEKLACPSGQVKYEAEPQPRSMPKPGNLLLLLSHTKIIVCDTIARGAGARDIPYLVTPTLCSSINYKNGRACLHGMSYSPLCSIALPMCCGIAKSARACACSAGWCRSGSSARISSAVWGSSFGGSFALSYDWYCLCAPARCLPYGSWW